VLRALDLDEVRLALLGQLGGHGDHVGPGRGRLRHQVVAVPQQLGVRVVRDAVELALPRRGLQGRLERALLGLALVGAGPFADPPGLADLRPPRDIQAEDVQRAVLRGEGAHLLLALAVRGAGQLVVLDHILAPALRTTGVRSLLDGARAVREVVEVQRYAAAAPTTARARSQQAPERHRGDRHNDGPTGETCHQRLLASRCDERRSYARRDRNVAGWSGFGPSATPGAPST